MRKDIILSRKFRSHQNLKWFNSSKHEKQPQAEHVLHRSVFFFFMTFKCVVLGDVSVINCGYISILRHKNNFLIYECDVHYSLLKAQNSSCPYGFYNQFWPKRWTSDIHFRSKNKMTQHFRSFLQRACRYSSSIHSPFISVFRRRFRGIDILVFKNLYCGESWTPEHVNGWGYFYYLRHQIPFELSITLLY
jgi:hypothetical protein